MDIEIIKNELKDRMEVSIDRIHKEIVASNQNAGSNYKVFKDQLYKTIFELIDKHKLEFRNHEHSKNFLEELKPTCEYLLTRYFIG
jgi:hypothetical protein